MKAVLAICVALGLGACTQESSTSSAPVATEPDVSLPAGMTRVSDPRLVCMVNDQHMDNPQLPVEVDGKTYYGCCSSCVGKLHQLASARTAMDPVTGTSVDKATAVMIRDEAGRVRYFASEETLRRYRQ